VTLGPVIVRGRRPVSEFIKEAESFGVKLEDLQDALTEINVFSYNRINAIVNLIRDIFSHMAQTGYHKKRLGEIRPEVVELDPLFGRYHEERVLNTLLGSCTEMLGADSGSVMKIDSATNMLHIKASSKLNEDIVRFTGIKVGEGIAGVAAAHGETIILPKDQNKNGLMAKMKREYIKSSMIIPFNKGDSHDIYGVINLNIARKDKEFSEKDVLYVKELVNMASIALTPLAQSDTTK